MSKHLDRSLSAQLARNTGKKAKKINRRERAEERAKYRDTLTNKAQLKRLDALFGVNKGARKERARLERDS